MAIAAYRRVLALREVRRILALGLVVRIPMWAANVVLTLHVVSHLHRSYAAAGLVTGLATVALAISQPWRGRRLDAVGLRAGLTPSLVVLAAAWSVAPFLSYLPLLILAPVAGLFEVPSFSIVRQTLLHIVPREQRRTALSIDSVFVEISFMIGPVLGVLLATYTSTTWALLGCQLAVVLGGALMWLVNPPLRPAVRAADDADAPAADAPAADAPAADAPAADAKMSDGRASGTRAWLTPGVLAILAACAAATLVLTGTDVAIVAALRDLGHQSSIGWVLAVWGLGSAVGGIGYGALRRGVPVFVLLALLSAATVPVAFGSDRLSIAALLFVAGFFCAPTITATVDALSRMVPEHVRGEAFGWHGAAMTAGSAVGAPLAGVAIDGAGWKGGFVLPGVIGLLVAGAGLLVVARSGATQAEAGTEVAADVVG